MTLSKKFQASGLLSTGEVAKEMGVHRSTVWLWIKSEMLKSSKVGDFIGVKRADLVKFQAGYHVNGEKKKGAE
jgi:excisionase family DNA binding protein